jgi:uncharacterized membrane protein
MKTSDTSIPVLTAASPARRTGITALLGCWWVAFSLSSICVVSGHLMIKAGLNAAAPIASTGTVGRIVTILSQPGVIGGLMIYLFGTACWMIAVSQKEISFLYPLSSLNYVLVVLASAFLLAESISLRRAEGILLIVCGMFLLNRRAQVMRA